MLDLDAELSGVHVRLCLLLLLLLSGRAMAEDPGPAQLAVLDPKTGRALGHYLMIESVRLEIEQGTETPHFEGNRRFLYPRNEPNKPTGEDGIHPFSPGTSLGDKIFLGKLPNGERLLWFRKSGSQGPVKAVDASGRARVLVASTTFGAAGRTFSFHEPRLVTAGPYLLVEQPAGVRCSRLSDGKVLWQSTWKFEHCRWNNGAFYAGGALYADTPGGLARVDPSNGKILWTWPDAVEVQNLVLGPDGHLYLTFIEGPKYSFLMALGKAAVERYGWPSQSNGYPRYKFVLRTIPFRDTYFGFTYYAPDDPDEKNYLKGGRAAVWERLDGKWSWIFDYDCAGTTESSLDALYAKNRLSSAMRKRLTREPLN